MWQNMAARCSSLAASGYFVAGTLQILRERGLRSAKFGDSAYAE
ncbi:hypothetical protein ACVWXO_011141 [Bradyrhizobium sp. LM2.7]